MKRAARLMHSAVMDKIAVNSFEEEVGITTFANCSSGFSGVLKHRFSDFVVREVSLDGSVAKLGDTSGIELEKKWFGGAGSEALSSDEKVEKIVSQIILFSADDSKLSEEQCTELRTFISNCLDKSQDCALDFTGIVAKDKAGRGTIHGLFKGEMSKLIESTTVQTGDKSVIRLIAKHKTKGSGVKLDKRSQWPPGLGSYLQFTMLKENIDTLSAASVLNKNLFLGTNGIKYNGTKDKRGVTAQFCTVFRKKPSDFARTNAYEHTPVIRCGDFKYVDKEAGLGGLAGNRFEIVLRSLNKPTDVIRTSCAAMEESGFINYFGLQRFGKGGSKSHDVGRAIMKSDFKACCDMMFTPSEHDRDVFAQAKVHYAKGEYGEALALLPNSYYAEKSVLQKLKNDPRNFTAAYNSIMKHTRLLCAHAYQSYVWNLAASRRISEYGMKCVVGDLVPLDGSVLTFDDVDEDEREAQEESDVATAAAAAAGQSSGDMAAVTAQGNDFQKARSGANIHIVTAEDVASGKFSVRDVILPLPGYAAILPSNSIGTFYTDLLAKDGLTLDSYSNSKCHPQYAMAGAYRRLIQMPQDFEWKVVEYQKFNQEIAETELTAMRAVKAASAPAATEEEEGEGDAAADVAVQGNKVYTALQLKFTLPPGTYATMMLRELTKESTESQFQAQLTVSSAKRPLSESGAGENESAAKTAKLEN